MKFNRCDFVLCVYSGGHNPLKSMLCIDAMCLRPFSNYVYINILDEIAFCPCWLILSYELHAFDYYKACYLLFILRVHDFIYFIEENYLIGRDCVGSPRVGQYNKKVRYKLLICTGSSVLGSVCDPLLRSDRKQFANSRWEPAATACPSVSFAEEKM